LYLEEVELHRVGGPADFQTLAGQRPVLDRGARVIEREAARLVIASQRQPSVRQRLGIAGPGADEIGAA
jgi:hypothetical protein